MINSENLIRKVNLNLKIPFDKFGNMQREANYDTRTKKDNYIFFARITIKNVYRSGHAHYLEVYIKEGEGYNEIIYNGYMSISDFVKMAQNTIIQYGEITGYFAFNRIGSAFGIIYVGSE